MSGRSVRSPRTTGCAAGWICSSESGTPAGRMLATVTVICWAGMESTPPPASRSSGPGTSTVRDPASHTTTG